jgi:hypothetical protein
MEWGKPLKSAVPHHACLDRIVINPTLWHLHDQRASHNENAEVSLPSPCARSSSRRRHPRCRRCDGG